MKLFLAAALVFVAAPASAQQSFLFERITGFALGSYTVTQEFNDANGFREETTRSSFKGTGFTFESMGEPSITIGGAASVDGDDTVDFNETLIGDDYSLSGFVYSVSNQGLSISLQGKVRDGALTYFRGTFSGGGQIGFNARFETQGRISSSAAIPEPGTWAMMIGGLGLAGMALRRRSTLVRFA